MTEKPNPLFHVRKGEGPYNALIEFDGMNRFIREVSPFDMCDRKIAQLEGATLRYTSDTEVCDMKVYHPTEKDYDGDTCSIAAYEFYNLKLDSMYGGRIRFKGLLVGIRLYEEEPVVTERDGYPYLPPYVKSDVFPIPVTLTLWYPRDEED